VPEINSKLKNRLRVSEGFRAKPYRCPAGKLTIGYGRNLEDKGISRIEAEFLLDNDIAEAQALLRRYLPWTDNLDQARRDVLVDMVFNMGIGSAKTGKGLLSFQNALKHIQRGEYAEAAFHMLDSRWAKQVGGRAEQLARIMETGVEE